MITAIGDVMRECYSRGWITTRDGNVSLRRRSTDLLYITPSGTRKTIIHPESIQKIKITNNQLVVHDDLNASGELHMHWNIQSKFTKETCCVLHVHPTNIISAMYAGWDLQALSSEFPEIYRYTRVGKNVPILPPISKELGDATFSNFAFSENHKNKFDIVGQANHGACSIGKNPWDAFEHIERLEHICEIVLLSGVRPPRSI